MTKIFSLLLLVLVSVSCSSQKRASKEVDKEAQAVTPAPDPRTQYARAISQIRNSKELDEKRKEKLVDVVNTYAMKSREVRLKQSQYRAVLVSEMLNSGTRANPRVDAAKKSLTKLDDESSKQLGKFIRDFKFHAGNTPDRLTPMREIIRFQ